MPAFAELTGPADWAGVRLCLWAGAPGSNALQFGIEIDAAALDRRAAAVYRHCAEHLGRGALAAEVVTSIENTSGCMPLPALADFLAALAGFLEPAVSAGTVPAFTPVVVPIADLLDRAEDVAAFELSLRIRLDPGRGVPVAEGEAGRQGPAAYEATAAASPQWPAPGVAAFRAEGADAPGSIAGMAFEAALPGWCLAQALEPAPGAGLYLVRRDFFSAAASAEVPHPIYYAPAPLVGALCSGTVKRSERGADTTGSVTLTGIDAELVARDCFAMVEQLLAPGAIANARRADAAALGSLIDSKRAIAEAFAGRLRPLFVEAQASAVMLGAARALFRERLQESLAAAYDTAVVMQFVMTGLGEARGGMPLLAGQPSVAAEAAQRLRLSAARFARRSDAAGMPPLLGILVETTGADAGAWLDTAVSFHPRYIELPPAAGTCAGACLPRRLQKVGSAPPDLDLTAAEGCRIPLPLRRMPRAPALIFQAAAVAGAGAPSPRSDTPAEHVKRARQWRYEMAWSQPEAAQDRLEFEVQYNAVESPAEPARPGPDCEALLVFESRREQLAPALQALSQLPSGQSPDAGMGEALGEFAELVAGVAAMLARLGAPAITPPRSLAADADRGHVEETIAAGSGSSPSIVIDAPAMSAGATGVTADICAGPGDDPAAPAGWKGRCAVFLGLDALAQRSARASLRIVRNRALGQSGGFTVAPDFVFRTSQSAAPGPVRPFLTYDTSIDLRRDPAADGKEVLSQQLTRFLGHLMAGVSDGLLLSAQAWWSTPIHPREPMENDMPWLRTPLLHMPATLADAHGAGIARSVAQVLKARLEGDGLPVPAGSPAPRLVFTFDLGVAVDTRVVTLLRLSEVSIRAGEFQLDP